MSLSQKMLSDLDSPSFSGRVLEVANMITEWTGSDADAYQWYVSHPIASMSNKTAEQVVREKDFILLVDYLNKISLRV